MAVNVTKTMAQKINSPRDERGGRLGNSIMRKNTLFYPAATAEFWPPRLMLRQL
jgi:hypothetical protein